MFTGMRKLMMQNKRTSVQDTMTLVSSSKVKG